MPEKIQDFFGFRSFEQGQDRQNFSRPAAAKATSINSTERAAAVGAGPAFLKAPAKFFVIVGAQPGKNYLAVIATSKQKWRDNKPGGNPDGGYYHIPGGGRDWFPADTWLLFEAPQELSANELLARKFKNEIVIKGSLRPDIANAICNCMRQCQDVSEYHKVLLGPAIQPKPKGK